VLPTLDDKCPKCGAELGSDASHLLTCVRLGYGVSNRHHAVVRLLQEECRRLGFLTEYTPTYRVHTEDPTTGRRTQRTLIPDLVAIQRHRILAFDVSFVNVTGVTNLRRRLTATEVASGRDAAKRQKYELVRQHLAQRAPHARVEVVPVTIDIRGALLSPAHSRLTFSAVFLQEMSAVVARHNQLIWTAAALA
jgi:hypothetical protein